jgi:hypothetical protein
MRLGEPVIGSEIYFHIGSGIYAERFHEACIYGSSEKNCNL